VRIGGEVGLEKSGKIEIKGEVVVNLLGGEFGVIPVERVIFNLELNRLRLDPPSEKSWGERIPREALPAEKGGG
jgi:hypothetical protein